MMSKVLGNWIVGVATLILAANATAQPRVQARLIADTEIAKPGSTIRVGVLLDIPDRAHIYWRNPGDAGLATGIEWGTDLAVGDLQWPAPRQFAIEGLDETYFGYTKQVLLYSEVKIPELTPTDTSLTLHAKVYWLLCLDDGACIPDDRPLEISIPVGGKSRLAYEATLFDRFAATVPRSISLPHEIRWTKSSLTLEFRNTPGSTATSVDAPIRFFPYEGGGWTPGVITTTSFTFTPDYAGDTAVGGVVVFSTIANKTGQITTRYMVIPGPADGLTE